MAPLTGFAGFGGGSSGLTVAGGAPGTGIWYGDRGIFCAGVTSGGTYYDTIEYFDFENLGNTTDFGNLVASFRDVACASDGTKALFCGGKSKPHNTRENFITWVTTASTGNATDRGDLAMGGSEGPTGHGNGEHALIAGGIDASTNKLNNVDIVVIGTTGNATDFGDLSIASYIGYGAGDLTRCLIALGATGGSPDGSNNIDYFTYASAGNATDFGDLQSIKMDGGGCSDQTRSLFGGGWKFEGGNQPATVEIDYVATQTTGNASGFGDLSQARANGVGGCSSGSKAAWGGGYTGSGFTDRMDYVTIASTGNASDFGNLVNSRHSVEGTSGGA